MIVKYQTLLLIGALSAAFLCPCIGADARPNAPSPMWVTGYYPGWQDDLKPADIDYSSLTHIIYFTIFPKADGSLDFQNGVNDATANALARDAHKAGVKVLICLGGDGAAKAYRAAIKPGVRDTLVKNMVDWVKLHNFDGVDIDFEPMKQADLEDFKAFVVDLRQGLNQLDPKMQITAAVECGGFSNVFGELKDDFDQLNLMTYDMAGPWSAETWYNSPLHNAKAVKGLDGDPLPATDEFVAKWTKDVPVSKLGIGVCCEGRVWHGSGEVAQDRQGLKVETQPYSVIMDQYFQTDRYHWDDGAKASSLVVPGDGDSKALVVYDDIRDAREKVDYAKKVGIGGIILWELSEEYRLGQPPGRRHPLSSAVRTEIDSVSR